MRQKNMDYSGGDGDPFANFRIAECFGLHPVTGIILRMTDKLQRVRAFIKNGVCAVDGESVDDACDDLVNYAILMKGLLREERSKLSSTQITSACADGTPRYRILNPGEFIEAGDESRWEESSENSWSPVLGIFIGSQVSSGVVKDNLVVRRPL